MTHGAHFPRAASAREGRPSEAKHDGAEHEKWGGHLAAPFAFPILSLLANSR